MKDTATIGQTTRILNIINEEKPSFAQGQGMVGNADLLKMLVQRGHHLKEVDREAFKIAIGLEDNPYAVQRVTPRSTYPAKYHPLPPHLQYTGFLQHILPHADYDSSYIEELTAQYEYMCRRGAELLQVYPKLSVLAKHLEVRDPYGKGFAECLSVPLGFLIQSRKFNNYLNYIKARKDLRLISTIADMYKEMEENTPGDFMVQPIQSGKRYAGYSPLNARQKSFDAYEWPLDPYIVAWHLLTHPERLMGDPDELRIDCPGAISMATDQKQDLASLYTPAFVVNMDTLELVTRMSSDPYDHFGTASGFLLV